MYVNYYMAAKHLQLDDMGDDEREYVESLIDAAEGVVEQHLNRPLTELENRQGQLPAPIVQAILLCVGNLYANRESVVVGVSANKIPLSYEYLLSMYRKY